MRPLFFEATQAGGEADPSHALVGERVGEQLASAVWQIVAVSSGRCALDCVRAPEAAEHNLGIRARRLIRQAQISAW
jgi:hypothetical protein